MGKIVDTINISILTFVIVIIGIPTVYADTTPTLGSSQTSVTSAPIKSVPTSAPSPTVNPSDAQNQSQVEKIKEMVAQKVAKLNLVEKKGILGTVKTSTTTQITLLDLLQNERIVETDELTKFVDSASSSKTFGISDIKAGDLLSCVGLYNKETKHLLARVITRVHALPSFIEGVVTDKDSVNFTVTAIDDKGVKRIINIDTSTTMQSYSKDVGTIKSGFSKITAGQRIFAAGFYDANIKNQINASRVIYFIDLPPSANMKKAASIDTSASTTPSSGSGSVVTPTKK